MPKQRDVAVIVGSLRKDSLNRRMARNLESLAPDHLRMQIIEIRDLPLYDQDLEATPPGPWVAFRERIRRADAILFVTPEYNRSIPSPLKNAIDVGSRPYGQNAWDGKPAAIVSVSPGAVGGFGANHHLRQSLVFLNVPAMQQPEAYIGRAAELFDPQGTLQNDKTRAFMTTFMTAFSAWIDTVTKTS
jgi:chromate reductase, NAD(P)H dehydrogenase (quinone)